MPRSPIDGKYTEVVLDTHELAWAAGFFDGEGTTYYDLASEKHNPILRVSIPQKDKRPLLRFRKAILNLSNFSKRADGMWCLKTSNFEDSQAVIGLLWKFLSEPKREQYRLAISKYKDNWKGNLRQGWGNRITPAGPAPLKAVMGEGN